MHAIWTADAIETSQVFGVARSIYLTAKQKRAVAPDAVHLPVCGLPVQGDQMTQGKRNRAKNIKVFV